MTGIQALERACKTLPMKPGRVEPQEFEYIRVHCYSSLAHRIEPIGNRIIFIHKSIFFVNA